MKFEHQSVLLWECIEALQIQPDGVYIDGTLGGAGHSTQIAKRLNDNGRLIGIDQDAAAIEVAGERLAEFGDKAVIVRSNYSQMKTIASQYAPEGVDGILLDLGVSSYQLDTVERGFGYKNDASLDMRMDQRQSITAKDIVNQYSERELFRIIKEYGEDQFAKNIAKHIVLARQDKPINTTFELNEIINLINEDIKQYNYTRNETMCKELSLRNDIPYQISRLFHRSLIKFLSGKREVGVSVANEIVTYMDSDRFVDEENYENGFTDILKSFEKQFPLPKEYYALLFELIEEFAEVRICEN